jgi:hypothetical protein
MADQMRETAAYVRSNVLPAIRVRPSFADARQAVSTLYAPAAVVPLQACGGFNCVVELSSSTCRIQAQAALHPTTLDRTIEHDTFNKIAGAATGAPSTYTGDRRRSCPSRIAQGCPWALAA